MKTKIYIYIIFILIFDVKGFCQSPDLQNNYTKYDTIDNPILKSFIKDYDFVIAYTEENYWWSDRKYYQIIALKNNEWSNWRYSDFRIKERKDKYGKKITDTIRTGKFWEGKKKINNSMTTELLTEFKTNNFWQLEKTPPDQYAISDGTNYRFEIYHKNKIRIIEYYEPDFFLERNPNSVNLKDFIKSRDYFLKWWKEYCC